MQSFRHGQLANLEFGRTEVDKGPVFETCRTQVTQRLGDMVVNDGPGRLDLKDQLFFYQDVRNVLADDRAVLIIDRQRFLLLDRYASLAQPMDESILIHLLQVTGTVITMDGVASFPNDVRQLKDAIFHSSPLQNSRPRENTHSVACSFLSPFFVSFGYPIFQFLFGQTNDWYLICRPTSIGITAGG